MHCILPNFLVRDNSVVWQLKSAWQMSKTNHVENRSCCRSLRKHILTFLLMFIRCLSRYTDGWRIKGERMFIGDLAHAVALNLDLADNPQYYDLPVLETALECLACLTAQPHWSSYCRLMDGPALCSRMLTSLVQVEALGVLLAASDWPLIISKFGL